MKTSKPIVVKFILNHQLILITGLLLAMALLFVGAASTPLFAGGTHGPGWTSCPSHPNVNSTPVYNGPQYQRAQGSQFQTVINNTENSYIHHQIIDSGHCPRPSWAPGYPYPPASGDNGSIQAFYTAANLSVNSNDGVSYNLRYLSENQANSVACLVTGPNNFSDQFVHTTRNNSIYRTLDSGYRFDNARDPGTYTLTCQDGFDWTESRTFNLTEVSDFELPNVVATVSTDRDSGYAENLTMNLGETYYGQSTITYPSNNCPLGPDGEPLDPDCGTPSYSCRLFFNQGGPQNVANYEEEINFQSDPPSFQPTTTGEYSLVSVCNSTEGLARNEISDVATVIVIDPNEVNINAFDASTPIDRGDTTYFTWNVTNAQSCTISSTLDQTTVSPIGPIANPKGGHPHVPNPPTTTEDFTAVTYTLFCSNTTGDDNNGSTDVAETTVVVNEPDISGTISVDIGLVNASGNRICDQVSGDSRCVVINEKSIALASSPNADGTEPFPIQGADTLRQNSDPFPLANANIPTNHNYLVITADNSDTNVGFECLRLDNGSCASGNRLTTPFNDLVATDSTRGNTKILGIIPIKQVFAQSDNTTITADYQENTSTACKIDYFGPETITAVEGSDIYLEWNAFNARDGKLTPSGTQYWEALVDQMPGRVFPESYSTQGLDFTAQSVNPNQTTTTRTYTLICNDENGTGTDSKSVMVISTKASPGTFTINTSPSSAVVPGLIGNTEPVCFDVSINPTNGFSDNVTLNVSSTRFSNAQYQVTYDDPTDGIGNGPGQVLDSSEYNRGEVCFTLRGRVARGTYPLRITGTSGSVSRSADVSIIIQNQSGGTVDEI